MTDRAPNELRVMTFNLKFARPERPHAWPDRRPIMAELIRQQAPDLIGTQEGLFEQIKALASDLDVYDWIGLGREGGSRGEYAAIFYRRDRFEPLEYDHFWLSDTPETIGSATWGHTNRRMVTWVRFHDMANGRDLYFWNTHFDHAIAEARERAARLVLHRIASLAPDVPIVFTGDFNAAAEASLPYDILTQEGGFRDAWTEAPHRGPAVATFHGYEGPRPGVRIDWILLRGPIHAVGNEIVTDSRDGEYPSDHFPVVADLRFEL